MFLKRLIKHFEKPTYFYIFCFSSEMENKLKYVHRRHWKTAAAMAGHRSSFTSSLHATRSRGCAVAVVMWYCQCTVDGCRPQRPWSIFSLGARQHARLQHIDICGEIFLRPTTKWCRCRRFVQGVTWCQWWSNERTPGSLLHHLHAEQWYLKI